MLGLCIAKGMEDLLLKLEKHSAASLVDSRIFIFIYFWLMSSIVLVYCDSVECIIKLDQIDEHVGCAHNKSLNWRGNA